MQKLKGQIMIEKCKKQPLKSACWIYLALTLVPGVFLPDNAGYLTESFVRCLLPGAIACWIAVKAFGAQRSSLGVEGFWKSLLYSSPIAVLCIINLVTAKHGEIAFHQVVWASCTALGEELMARFMLFRGIALGSAGEDILVGNPILLSAVIFGVMHAVNAAVMGTWNALFQIVYTAVIGALFAWSYNKTGCLLGGILWHALLNLTSML